MANQLELSLLHLHLFDEGVVFNQEAMHGEGTLEYCRQHHITIQAWGPLKSGAVITGEDDPPSQAAQDVAQLIGEMAQEKGVSKEAIALAWLLRASGEDAAHHRHDEAGAHQGVVRGRWCRVDARRVVSVVYRRAGRSDAVAMTNDTIDQFVN